MAMRLVSQSTSSLPLRSMLVSLQSGMSDSLLAPASEALIFCLIWSSMSGLPLSLTMSCKPAPLGMVIGAYGTPAYLSLTHLMKRSMLWRAVARCVQGYRLWERGTMRLGG